MDFWWIDWQQGEDKGNTGQSGRPDRPMNPTIWTDKMRVTDPVRRCRMGVTSAPSHKEAAAAEHTSRSLASSSWSPLPLKKSLAECTGTGSGVKRGVVHARW